MSPTPMSPCRRDLVEEVPADLVEPEVIAPPATFRERLAKARDALSGYFGSILSPWRRRRDLGRARRAAHPCRRRGQPPPPRSSTSSAPRPRPRTSPMPPSGRPAQGASSRTACRVTTCRWPRAAAPSVWLFVGVNGVGKTTTIGKLARREVDAGHTVVLAAGDTFRAAAAEQLEMWAERADADIVRAAEGADPSSVIFDGIEHAAAEGADLVLADTAGRLHTKTNLMEELSQGASGRRQGRRHGHRGAAGASTPPPARTGSCRRKQFTEAVEVTGVVLTKLDGSARGGIVLAIWSELGIPVKLVGPRRGCRRPRRVRRRRVRRCTVRVLIAAAVSPPAGPRSTGHRLTQRPRRQT